MNQLLYQKGDIVWLDPDYVQRLITDDFDRSDCFAEIDRVDENDDHLPYHIKMFNSEGELFSYWIHPKAIVSKRTSSVSGCNQDSPVQISSQDLLLL